MGSRRLIRVEAQLGQQTISQTTNPEPALQAGEVAVADEGGVKFRQMPITIQRFQYLLRLIYIGPEQREVTSQHLPWTPRHCELSTSARAVGWVGICSCVWDGA